MFSTVNFGKNTGLKNDRRDGSLLAEDEIDSNKPLKYYTTNYFSDGIKNQAGINFSEGFGLSRFHVATESELTRPGFIRSSFPQQLPALPLPTTAGLTKYGPIYSQESLRDRKSCQPTADNFYNRSFSIFNKPINVQDHIQKSIDFRQGVNTRAANKFNLKNN